MRLVAGLLITAGAVVELRRLYLDRRERLDLDSLDRRSDELLGRFRG